MGTAAVSTAVACKNQVYAQILSNRFSFLLFFFIFIIGSALMETATAATTETHKLKKYECVCAY